MVVVLEEKENSTKLITIVAWFLFVVAIGVAAYFVFFQAPATIQYLPPPDFPNLSGLDDVKKSIDPTKVLQSPLLQQKQYTPVFSGGSVGRSNPFTPF
jgi:hypothetical protein